MSRPGDQDSDRTEVILRQGAHVFGRYTLAAMVGKGGMGVVWRARDEKLERDVALKFLPDRLRESCSRRQAFALRRIVVAGDARAHG